MFGTATYLQNKHHDLSIIYDSWYRENRINMLSEQSTTMNWKISQMSACTIVPYCYINSLETMKMIQIYEGHLESNAHSSTSI